MIPIIIPAYEPDERLIQLLDGLKAENLFPVVIVDDGSGEAYRHLFKRAEEEYGCAILRHAVNLGKGRGLKTAFNYCLNNYPEIIGCITVDSDGQHPPQCIQKVKQAMEANPCKLILGVRDFDGDSVPNKSKFGNKLTRFVCKALCGVKVSDTQTGLRGIPADFMGDLLECPGERFEFETRMLVQTKDRYEIVEVEIETIYDSKENHSTHFDPLKDSIRIYKIFGAMFIRFLISSLSSSALDLWLFYMFCSALRGMNMELYVAIATVTARIISAIYNYLINYRVVFRSNAKHGRTAVRYFALAVVQMLCSAGIVTCLVGTLNVQTELVVKIPVDVLLFFVSYMIQREFVYKDGR